MTIKHKIEISDLKKSFGSKEVLNGVDLTLKPRESLVIIGGSGTGKSVLIKCILGFIKPDQGEILVDGSSVLGLSTRKRNDLMRKVGMLFQGSALFDSMSVWENVAFGLIQGLGMKRSDARDIAFDKLAAVNLDSKIGELYPAELSGGMQKRVALARAIAGDPDIIFFDEPTTGLDPITSGVINELIRQCVHKIGASAITITHDIASLRAIANRVALLYQGKIIWKGTVPEMDSTANAFVRQFIDGLPHGPFTTNDQKK